MAARFAKSCSSALAMRFFDGGEFPVFRVREFFRCRARAIGILRRAFAALAGGRGCGIRARGWFRLLRALPGFPLRVVGKALGAAAPSRPSTVVETRSSMIAVVRDEHQRAAEIRAGFLREFRAWGCRGRWSARRAAAGRRAAASVARSGRGRARRRKDGRRADSDFRLRKEIARPRRRRESRGPDKSPNRCRARARGAG